MKIGITGEHGFVGSHLRNYLLLQSNIEIVPFQKIFFDAPEALGQFIRQCDTIVHLAGMNRHPDPQVIYRVNLELTEHLIGACRAANATPHILFASSTQEERDNAYGDSKKAARLLLEQWAADTGAKVTGMVIPNVFGPFGKPFYNSVVATFCHQIARNETPRIDVDGDMKLIYVNELITDIAELIQSGQGGKIEIAPRHELKVSDLLYLLQSFKSAYLDQGAFPPLDTPLQLALFNTFRCYVPHQHYPVPFTLHTDNRGFFVELARTGSAGQTSYSVTKAGITRGNHFHTRKAERFAVIKGQASIRLRKMDSDEVVEYIIDGDRQPAFVDMPVWHTHNITNIGTEELLTVFWINEPYNPDDPDTYFVAV